MTNREWLNSLTNEKFAWWYLNIGCGACAHNPEKGWCVNISNSDYDSNYCIDGITQWLKAEHKENDDEI